MSTPFDLKRMALAALGLLLCFYGVLSAGRIGLSRLFSDYAALTGAPDSIQQAVQLAPTDPEAHYINGLALNGTGRLPEAIQEYERAVALRPRDYFTWLSLGDARDLAGDTQGAIAATEESVRLAPFYSQPRWQLGNLYFRAGRFDEAFAELRRAAAAEPTLLPAVIDLAWGSNKNVQAVEAIIQPQTPAARLALAQFFARHGETGEALKLFRQAGDVGEKERRSLLNDMLAAKRYREAFEVWLSGHPAIANQGQDHTAQIIDGGFEGTVSFDDPGFGWQPSRDAVAARFSIDTAEPKEAAHSLRVDWSGDSPPNVPVISQLVLVEPKTHYKLRFAARSQELVTGGLPVIVISDASSADGHMLAQSQNFPQGTKGWSDFTVDFNTGDSTNAIIIGLQRNSCGGGPCPIYGRVWLDNFSLQR